ncbi:nitronate monooxygenase [Dactylosporangium sp. NPDC049140]|uniref:NAD(P)H-dependent flavin oxidoreductase n=1 Tax=Dactylosporangium sp. NPDC049140 TaxID=3155647 RepID=UPI0033D56FA6
MRTRFTDAFGLTTPIAQAGMAFVGMTPDLAVAVGNAGALGSLGVGLMPAPALTATIAAIRSGTDGPLNVNFITTFTGDEQIDAACAAGVEVASFHWGHPPQAWIDRLHAAGVKVFEQVGSVDAARAAVDGGADAVVAQGQEAGGHNASTLPLFALLPLVADAVGERALVLAAGGIADGRGLAAALLLGADGAWVGTRLVATVESAAHDGYKQRLVLAAAEDTERTSLFGPETPQFNPMRVLRNRVVREWAGRTDDIPDSPLPVIGETVLGGRRMPMHRFSNLVPMRDATTGDLEEMALLSGQGVGLVHDIRPAADVIASMTAEAEKLLGGAWSAR